ncbi:sigma-54-dependent Fis family transcriptional regulator [Desulfonatronovibrio hydrogenovorans]|uniref:sigma-54-dependent Fis family transcriptional regulator n=1 Tax=Desulfonatronovibrio hydrogenovorans TaxID=53245 RepID=UPI00048CCF4E|nr:sigma-54-dependent Fis family transcriptional regulator [Desulfonatronovibrio hydrogenovorans]
MKHLTESKLKVLYEISRIIGQALQLDRSLESILAVLADSLCMNRGTVTILDDETGLLNIRASHGLSGSERKKGIYRLGEGVTGRIFATGQPFIVPDISKEPLFLDKTGARSMEKDRVSFIGVPIVLQGVPVGVLTVDRLFEQEISFEEDIRFLTIVAALVAQFVSLNRQVRAREEDLRRENQSLKTKLSKSVQRFFIVGKSRAMTMVHQMIEKVAPTRATVLFLGESGTGKTLTARIIHELSERTNYPFIKVNCASLPENLLESELFGYEKGAFTGAVGSKPGRFEEAHKGTIFLDEIGEMPHGIQAKLLRFLQEREFERLGGTRTIRVDVRIIAATNKDLAGAVRQARFRDDLFYRLNVFPITVPALRDRKEDIPALLNHFLNNIAKEYGRRLYFTQACLDFMVNYEWPGNIREMENLVEQVSIMAEGNRIDLMDLPLYLMEGSRPSSGGPLENRTLEHVEKKEILSALERNSWIQSRAARDLGITQRQMGYKVLKFGLKEHIAEKKTLIREE